jgi:P27 family predicted phage terminase small subunit
MAGARPKPTAIKILQGNPGKRPLNMDEPKPRGTPTCPKFLDKIAKQEWKRISKELTVCGLLTAVDRAALTGYCLCWSRLARAEAHVQNLGEIVRTATGDVIPNPWLGVVNRCLDQMRKYLIEFGMTPASRSRIHITQQESQNTWDEMFGDSEPTADHVQ